MSQSFIKKPNQGPHSALAGLGVLKTERQTATLPLLALPEPDVLGWHPVHGTWHGYTAEAVRALVAERDALVASLVRDAALEEAEQVCLKTAGPVLGRTMRAAAAIRSLKEQPEQPDSGHSASGDLNGSYAAKVVPPEIAAIIERLHTQDNRITADPLFAVQQKRTIGGLDEGYADDFAWVCEEGIEAGDEEARHLNALHEAGDPIPDGWRRVGYIDKWEFVTGGLTEQGCKDFIACNGHNLKEPRIYAYGSYRNAEWKALRAWLMSLRAPSLRSADTDRHRSNSFDAFPGALKQDHPESAFDDKEDGNG